MSNFGSIGDADLSCFAILDGIAFPFFVNHTVNYDERYGQMPFLSQILDLSSFNVLQDKNNPNR